MEIVRAHQGEAGVTSEVDDSYRPLTGGLVLGILFCPILFVWFLLRPGYSREVRIGAFAYVAIGLVGLAFSVLR